MATATSLTVSKTHGRYPQHGNCPSRIHPLDGRTRLTERDDRSRPEENFTTQVGLGNQHPGGLANAIDAPPRDHRCQPRAARANTRGRPGRGHFRHFTIVAVGPTRFSQRSLLLLPASLFCFFSFFSFSSSLVWAFSNCPHTSLHPETTTRSPLPLPLAAHIQFRDTRS